MVKKVTVWLLAMSFLSLSWLGTTAWGQHPQVPRGFSLAQDTPMTVSRLIELLVEKEVITPQEQAMLHQLKPLPVSKEQNPGSDCLKSCP